MKHKINDLARPTSEDLKRARRVTPEEHDRWRHALANTFGRPFPSRMGRPPLGMKKKVPIALRMDRDVLARLRAKAAKIGIGYQTLINQWLGEKV